MSVVNSKANVVNNMSTTRLVITLAIMLTGFFFGAGNASLPPYAVIQYGNKDLVSLVLGFCGSALGLSIAGVYIMSRLSCSAERFFSILGPLNMPVRIISLAILGPLAIIPRCMVVSHGSTIGAYSIPSAVFCLIFTICMVLLVMNRKSVIRILGDFLTPIKLTVLGSMILVLTYYVYMSNHTPLPKNHFNLKKVGDGFVVGYQTADLIGAIFQSGLLLEYTKAHTGTDVSKSQKIIFQAGILSGILMFLIYCGLFYIMGANVNLISNGDGAHTAMPTIMKDVFPKFGAIFNMIVTCALCLVTGVAAFITWCDTIYDYSGRGTYVCYNTICFVSATVSYLIANFLGFNGITMILGKMTNIIYPLLIVIMGYHYYNTPCTLCKD